MFDPEAVPSVTKEDIIDVLNKALAHNEEGEWLETEAVLIELLEKLEE